MRGPRNRQFPGNSSLALAALLKRSLLSEQHAGFLGKYLKMARSALGSWVCCCLFLFCLYRLCCSGAIRETLLEYLSWKCLFPGWAVIHHANVVSGGSTSIALGIPSGSWYSLCRNWTCRQTARLTESDTCYPSGETLSVPSFSDIGKQTKDLLYGGKTGAFQYNQKLKITTKAPDGVSFALNTSKKGENMEADVKATYSFDPYTLEITAAQNGKVGLKATVEDLLTTGLKCSATVPLPMATPKLSVGYTRPYLNTSANVELKGSPKVDASVTTGHGNIVVGGDCSYDTAKSDFSKWALGAGYTQSEYQVGLWWGDKGDTLNALISHKLGTGLAGAEISKSFKDEGSTKFTLGMSHVLASGANVKYKVDSAGSLSALWEQSLDKSTKIGLSSEMNVKNVEKGPQLGVALEMNN